MAKKVIPPSLLLALNGSLEAVEEPFAPLASQCAMGQEELLQEIGRLQGEGIIRRFGALLNHFAAGVAANAMVVWRVPEQEVERVGKIMADFPAVTHCYERRPLPDFPYNLYSMVHASSWEKCEAIIRDISQRTGIDDYLPLRTVREFKKSSPPLVEGLSKDDNTGREVKN